MDTMPVRYPVSKLTRRIVVDELEDYPLTNHFRDIQGILINLDIEDVDQAINKLDRVNLGPKVMSNGLAFIWTHKTRIWELIQVMESKGFDYVENLVCCLFDADKLRELVHKLQIQQNVFDSDEQTEYLSAEDIAHFLIFSEFELGNGDRIENYFLREPSEFVSINKRTLLIFRRVN